MKIFLDLDGVFSDFSGAVLSITGYRYEDQDPHNVWYLLSKIPKLFSKLDLIPGSVFLTTVLKRHDLEFLTALPIPTGELYTAIEDKTEWVRKYVSDVIPINFIVGGKNKPQFLEDNPGALLIDDCVRNIQLWEKAGGIGIHHISLEETIKQLRQLKLIV